MIPRIAKNWTKFESPNNFLSENYPVKFLRRNLAELLVLLHDGRTIYTNLRATSNHFALQRQGQGHTCCAIESGAAGAAERHAALTGQSVTWCRRLRLAAPRVVLRRGNPADIRSQAQPYFAGGSMRSLLGRSLVWKFLGFPVHRVRIL